MTEKISASKNVPETQTFREIKIGKTTYCVTSIFKGEKDLGYTLEQLAIQKVLREIRQNKKTILEKI